MGFLTVPCANFIMLDPFFENCLYTLESRVRESVKGNLFVFVLKIILQVNVSIIQISVGVLT